MADAELFIEFNHARIFRMPGGELAFDQLSWQLQQGEAWAVTGPIGSGKTTFAEVIMGKHRVADGLACWPIVQKLGKISPSDVIRLVSFREESRAFSYSGRYYQQRFEFIQGDDDVINVQNFLGEFDTHPIIDQLGLRPLLHLPFLALSNGQTRRARIAKAMLAKPRILILDDPYIGLDVTARKDVSQILHNLHQQGVSIILVCAKQKKPDWITHELDLNLTLNLTQNLTKQPVSPALKCAEYTASIQTLPSTTTADQPAAFELKNVSVKHGHKTILHNVSWRVRQGERWALIGPNGSGKTTLLSLLCGDHPQAFSQDVQLFGKRRGSGESIWDVKKNVGLVSPEFHLYFSEPLNVFQVVGTGLTDTVTYTPVTAEQKLAINDILSAFGLVEFADRPFGKLSAGEQRLAILARSLIKKPKLLIWDEPFQCLDESAVLKVKNYLQFSSYPEQTMIFVTHEPGELPSGFTQTFRL